ncbi:hypothetical protein V8E54_012164 [Elaphomyces granulatus]
MSLLGKKFPAPFARPMAPFFAAGKLHKSIEILLVELETLVFDRFPRPSHPLWRQFFIKCYDGQWVILLYSPQPYAEYICVRDTQCD